VTQQSLTGLRDTIAQIYWQDSYQTLPRPNMSVSPSRQNAPQLRYLFVNPQTEDATMQYDPVYRRGWRGPYLIWRNGSFYTINAASNFTEQYGENGDPTVLDGWGNPIVLQNPGVAADGSQDVRLVSAGPDGVLNTPPNVLTANLTAALTGDDAYVSFELR